MTKEIAYQIIKKQELDYENLTDEQSQALIFLNNIENDIESCRNFLKDTDWYYSRKNETSELVPDDVVVKRKEAREFIRANKIVG